MGTEIAEPHTATGIRTPALIPLDLHSPLAQDRPCQNELGVPDFTWWRELFQHGIQPPFTPRIQPGKGSGYCRACGYPVLPSQQACGRCGTEKAK